MSLEDTYDALRKRAEELAKDLSTKDVEGLQSPGDGDPWRLLDLELLECDYDALSDLHWWTTALGKTVLKIIEKRA